MLGSLIKGGQWSHHIEKCARTPHAIKLLHHIEDCARTPNSYTTTPDTKGGGGRPDPSYLKNPWSYEVEIL